MSTSFSLLRIDCTAHTHTHKIYMKKRKVNVFIRCGTWQEIANVKRKSWKKGEVIASYPSDTPTKDINNIFVYHGIVHNFSVTLEGNSHVNAKNALAHSTHTHIRADAKIQAQKRHSREACNFSQA